jgi:hypothetical protein
VARTSASVAVSHCAGTDPPSSNVKRLPEACTGEVMNPLLIVAIPLSLIIVGMVLNNIGLSFDQPSSSQEQDPTKRLTAERESYRILFDKQRSRSLKRQKRVGQFAWLLVLATIGSFVWLYIDTVNKTTVSTQISALQTVPTEEGKQMVLSVTSSNGTNIKYLVKITKAEESNKEGFSKEKVSTWELEKLGTMLSIGDNALPAGVALKIAN